MKQTLDQGNDTFTLKTTPARGKEVTLTAVLQLLAAAPPQSNETAPDRPSTNQGVAQPETGNEPPPNPVTPTVPTAAPSDVTPTAVATPGTPPAPAPTLPIPLIITAAAVTVALVFLFLAASAISSTKSQETQVKALLTMIRNHAPEAANKSKLMNDRAIYLQSQLNQEKQKSARLAESQLIPAPLEQPTQQPTAPAATAAPSAPRPQPYREEPTPAALPSAAATPEFPTAPATPAPSWTPAPSEAAATATEFTGNVAADYNFAKTLEAAAGETRFLNYYPRSSRLTCSNHEEVRARPGTTPRFEEDDYGAFLVVEQGVRGLIVPYLDRDLVLNRQLFQSIFTYPDRPTATLKLIRPAVVEKTGADWLWASPGECDDRA